MNDFGANLKAAGGRFSGAIFLLFMSGLALIAEGPTSRLYLTGVQPGPPGTGNQFRIAVVQGPDVVLSWPECQIDQYGQSTVLESGIAVASTVRTLGQMAGQYGSEYSLTGTTVACHSYSNLIAGQVYDGTTDGTRNYTVELLTGTVYAADLNWQNPVLRFVIGGGWLGIAYDSTDNTLWVSSHGNPRQVRHYTLGGTLLSTFSAFDGTNCCALATALALDPADGTLWILGAGVSPPLLAQYSKQGVLLSTVTYPALAQFDVVGGEFQFQAGGSPAPFYRVCLLYDPTKAARTGSTVPIQLQLCDATGKNLSSSSLTVHATGISQASSAISGTVEDAGNANPDDDFRFDAALGVTGGYIFNLKTTGMGTGSYNLHFTVTADSFVYTAPFQIK